MTHSQAQVARWIAEDTHAMYNTTQTKKELEKAIAVEREIYKLETQRLYSPSHQK